MPGIFHPELHPLFEAAGYAAGFAVYRAQRASRGDALSDERRWVVIAAAAVGALVGARALGLLEQAPRMGLHWAEVLRPGGKTIVGGLLGGWIAVEVAKRVAGVRSRTGDLFAVPLCVGIAVGRLGCFFAGLADDTYGIATTLPWGVNFGDGVRRHPTQLYEFLFLAVLAVGLWRWQRRPHVEGQVFRGFMAAYLGWRLLVDFIKPQPVVDGLNWIQWACVAGLVWLAVSEVLRRREVRMFDGLKGASLPAKVATVFAVGALLSFGLCGFSVATGLGGDWGGRSANIESVCFFACVVGFVASLIWRSVSKRKDD